MTRTTLTLLACTLALAPGIAPGIANAAEPPCLTAPEVSSIATFALPGVISGLEQRCSANLPANAYLTTSGDALAQRYAMAKPTAWPPAKAAFLKLSAGAGGDAAAMLPLLPDDTLQQFVDTLAGSLVSQKVPSEHCGMVDQLVRLLAPLPPENIGDLLALAASRASKNGASPAGKFTICPAPASPLAQTPSKP